MLKKKLLETITSYKDFPKKGINFKDILPIFEDPELFDDLINQMAKNPLWNEIDAIIAIDARGFIIGSCLALKLSKPLLTARKKGKLPGEIIERKYKTENIRFVKNIKPSIFLPLLYNSIGIIGNSSVAIRECSYLGVPAINLGTRQINRERGTNVIDCNHNIDEIKFNLKNHFSSKIISTELYGDGNAATIISNKLISLY